MAKQVKDSELSLQWLWVAAVARVPSPARELPHAMEQQQIKKKKLQMINLGEEGILKDEVG